MTETSSSKYDVIIIGAGLVGMTTALALAHRKCRVALLDKMDPIDALAPAYDPRASAVSASAWNMFQRLGVARRLKGHTQAMTHIGIADGQVGNISPLTLSFDRDPVDGPSGYMIENKRLRLALYDRVLETPSIEFHAPIVTKQVERSESHVEVVLGSGKKLTADVLIAADGRNSPLRRIARIGTTVKTYKQSALTVTLAHTRPHQSTAFQIFYPTGPFALLPLTGNRSSLVWSDKPETLSAVLELPQEALIEEITRRTQGLLGQIAFKSRPLVYPLSLQMADAYTERRLALVGDAAHTIHPIAGQGLNMGLRDAAALTDVISDAKSRGLDIGGAELSAYEVWRNFDNRTLAGATDILNRLFSNTLGPLVHARRIGMTLIQGIDPLRQAFVKEAAGEGGIVPSLLKDL